MEDRSRSWWNLRILSIRLGDVLVLVGLYAFFAFIYSVTLYLNRKGYEDPEDMLFSFYNFADDGGLQYAVQLLMTAIVWVLVFRVFQQRPLWLRLLIHLVIIGPWVYACQQLYYVISEYYGFWHLAGSGQWWDIYIPTLFYILQFGIMHAYEYFVSYQHKLRTESALKNAALKSELSAIKSQLNPHFLYNVFNTINASVPPEMETTREMIAGLSDLFRYQLQASRSELVPLRDELNFVRGYLELEKRRFEDRLEIRLDVADALMDEMVPPMILQPIVENSIKHGLASLIEGGTVTIRVHKEGQQLRFEVSDTGVGLKDKSAALEKGIGLSNTQLRLQKMYNSGLQLLDNSPQGLIVRFTI